MKQLETDVIVVAAGLSGLAACCAAAEGGARVIAFEKASTTGGAANMAMGPLGVGSRIQREHVVAVSDADGLWHGCPRRCCCFPSSPRVKTWR